MAVANSMNHENPGQTSGVIDVSNPYFGPAQRDNYDISNWAMATTGSHTQEILLNPEPTDRKREPNTPAFLKPTPQVYQLSALIKILHAIPLSREALLCRTNVLADYGHDSEWWDGTPIKVLKVVDLTEGSHYNDRIEVIHETQRLVAFLDETDRAYGSTEVLANLVCIQARGQGSIVATYLEEWRKALNPTATGPPFSDIFLSIGKKTILDEAEAAAEHPFQFLELRIDEELADRGQTLYEAIDDHLWAGQTESTEEHVYLEKVADVLVIEAKRVKESDSGLGIRIPAVWYSDRYLQSSMKEAKEMLVGKATVQKEIECIEEAKSKVAKIRTSTTEPPIADGTQLVKSVTAYFQRLASSKYANDELQETPGISAISQQHSRYSIIANELKALTERIAQKLKGGVHSF